MLMHRLIVYHIAIYEYTHPVHLQWVLQFYSWMFSSKTIYSYSNISCPAYSWLLPWQHCAAEVFPNQKGTARRGDSTRVGSSPFWSIIYVFCRLAKAAELRRYGESRHRVLVSWFVGCVVKWGPCGVRSHTNSWLFWTLSSCVSLGVQDLFVSQKFIIWNIWSLCKR